MDDCKGTTQSSLLKATLTNVVGQGEKYTENYTYDIFLNEPHREYQDLKKAVDLYACDLTDAPRRENSGVSSPGPQSNLFTLTISQQVYIWLAKSRMTFPTPT
jgi:hypothetical protein